MKLYTGAGDGGFTSLTNGQKLPKDSPVFELLGTMDELNAHLGLVKTGTGAENAAFLEDIQRKIMAASAYIATVDGKYLFGAEAVADIEGHIDALQSRCPPLKGFAVPGECERSARVDVARTVARRAERRLGGLPGDQSDILCQYLNRLSDYLFALARYEAFTGSIESAVRRVLSEEGARMPQGNGAIGLNGAKALLELAEKEARAMNLPAVIAICGPVGGLIALHAMDGALPISRDVAQRKAYTAAALRMTTEELARHVLPGGMFYGLEALDGGKLCPIAGGAPLAYRGGDIAGAIGVSGGAADEDAGLLKRILDAWEAEDKHDLRGEMA